MKRRTLLASSAAAVTAVLAGCTDLLDEDIEAPVTFTVQNHAHREATVKILVFDENDEIHLDESVDMLGGTSEHFFEFLEEATEDDELTVVLQEADVAASHVVTVELRRDPPEGVDVGDLSWKIMAEVQTDEELWITRFAGLS